MKKYALYPGYVTSSNDGQRHYITAGELARLYGVSYHECVVVDVDRPECFRGHDVSGLTKLFPNRNGTYELLRVE